MLVMYHYVPLLARLGRKATRGVYRCGTALHGCLHVQGRVSCTLTLSTTLLARAACLQALGRFESASLCSQNAGTMQATARLVGWLRKLGVKYVLDIHSARSISLLLTAEEFVVRMQHRELAPASVAKGDAADSGRACNSAPKMSAVNSARTASQAPAESEQNGACGCTHGDGAARVATAEEADGCQPQGLEADQLFPTPMLVSACPGTASPHGARVMP